MPEADTHDQHADPTAIVGPMRSLGFEIVSKIFVTTQVKNSPLPSGYSEMALTRIDQAISWLGNSFPEVVPRAAGADTPIWEDRDIALERVKAFRFQSERILRDAERGTVDEDKFSEFHDFCDQQMRPAVTKLVNAWLQLRQKRHDDDMQSAKRASMDVIEEINQIGKMIDLISVNATIEAARVGDAGRGFGVIAHEVRDLSTRSRTAVEKLMKRQEIDGSEART